jgi:hypothetical protein
LVLVRPSEGIIWIKAVHAPDFTPFVLVLSLIHYRKPQIVIGIGCFWSSYYFQFPCESVGESEGGDAIIRISTAAHRMFVRLSRASEYGRVISPHDTCNP